MKIRPLRQYDNPDLSPFVIHFVSRGYPPNSNLPEDIQGMSPRERLFNGILKPRTIRAFSVFYGSDHPVVCFTECTPAGVQTLIREGRYGPWGVAFTKDCVFQKGGGPAFYIRGDEWSDVEAAALPARIRARCTKFWPGADLETANEILGDDRLTKAAEWTHEREWRVLGTDDPPGFRFEPEDVAFLVVGDWASANDRFPNVVIHSSGDVEDPDGVWIN